MNTHFAPGTGPYAALYNATLEQAAQAGGPIIEKVFAIARQALRDRAKAVRGIAERDQAELALRLLDHHARALSERFPKALAIAFRQPTPTGANAGGERNVTLANLQFDQLELMDSAQVQESVSLARSRQSAMLAAEAALAELNTFICAALGLKAVHPERNPLRPEVFVQTLQNLLAQTEVALSVRTDWLEHMGGALGKELSALYKTLSQQLLGKGVTAVGYSVVRAHDDAGPASASVGERFALAALSNPRGQRMNEHDDTVLTLDRLRRLLAGELDPHPGDSGGASFSAQFSREFESGNDELAAPDFEATVPAALEALREMKQVDRIMDRIGRRRHDGRPDDEAGAHSPQAVREHLRGMASGLGQTLSLEVVALMVENIARDSRLLEPIKDVVKNLEPALLRLALVDPRFFSDKQHPARRLLQEITHRSLAYEAVDTRGFDVFLEPLQRVVDPLGGMQIESAEPFEQALQDLARVWDQQTSPVKLENAVRALQHAEARNFLAAKIAREIEARPDARLVSAGVLDFMCGPWAQVVAHARIADGSRTEDPGQYQEIMAALLWSVQPKLTRKNIGELTRLVPRLLGKLREGLDLIDYPSVKTSAFFELLMKLHQLAFRALSKKEESTPGESVRSSLLDDAEPWVAPAEAKLSGFMEMPAELSASLPPVSTLQEASPAGNDAIAASAPVEPIITAPDLALPVGAWVELQVKGAWIRTQLSWASPHGTLFLFTSAYGSTQSMTRRSRDKLLAAGHLRIVSGQPVVDGALDAVVQTAMLNSMDIPL